jgi:N-acylneuraminate cytidylyltransferase
MKSLFFIPARGGSKRLPKKNIKLYNGLPLIQYSIAYAKFCNANKIVVSTDDDEIAEIAKTCGSEIIIRPPELAMDSSKTSSAAKHCLLSFEEQGFKPDVFVTLQPTSPLRPESLYVDCLKKFNNKFDSVISVSKNKYKLGKLENDIFIPNSYKIETRSQDLLQLYFENGLIYLSKPEYIAKDEFLGENIGTIITDNIYATADIDDEFDFDLSLFIFNRYPEKFNYLKKYL